MTVMAELPNSASLVSAAYLSCYPSIRCAGILIKPEHMYGGSAFHGGILVDRFRICRNKSRDRPLTPRRRTMFRAAYGAAGCPSAPETRRLHPFPSLLRRGGRALLLLNCSAEARPGNRQLRPAPNRSSSPVALTAWAHNGGGPDLPPTLDWADLPRHALIGASAQLGQATRPLGIAVSFACE